VFHFNQTIDIKEALYINYILIYKFINLSWSCSYL